MEIDSDGIPWAVVTFVDNADDEASEPKRGGPAHSPLPLRRAPPASPSSRLSCVVWAAVVVAGSVGHGRSFP